MADKYTSVLPTQPYESVAAGLVPEDVAAVALAWFPRRNPIYSRFRHEPAGGSTVRFANDRFRPRSVLLSAAINTAATSLTFNDISVIDVDDVLKIDDEFMLVTAVDFGTRAVTVTRGHAETTEATHAADSVAWLVTNTRTGAAVNIPAMSRKADVYVQALQTVQHAYSVGGAMQSKTNAAYDPTPLGRDKTGCLAMVLDDFEHGMLYGKLNPPSGTAGAAARPMQGGLDYLIITNRVRNPTNAAAYKPSDLIRDTIQRCFDRGGQPNVLLLSTDFLSGLSTWGLELVRTPAGETELGVELSRINAPWLDGAELIPHPLLRPGTAIALDSRETCVYLGRDVHDKPRGSRGDAFEGDIIMEGAIGITDESHAAMVSGITAFARSA